MGRKPIEEGKLIYHLTRIENLTSIMENGILPRNMLRGNHFFDVADPNIIKKRHNRGLGDYVPFHFHPYSAFDYVIKRDQKMENLVYLCVLRSYARERGFVILPEHPLSGGIGEGCLLPYDEGVVRMDWESMNQSDVADAHAKSVRMAECLKKGPVLFSELYCIYVMDPARLEQIETMVRTHAKVRWPYVFDGSRLV